MKNYTEEQLEALSTSEWVEILKENPELADKCDKWEEFEGEDWSNLLSAQPQLADRCDKVNGWGKLIDFDYIDEDGHYDLSAWIELLTA